MSSKRNIAITIRILFLLAVVVIGLGAALYFYLPHYLESRIIPQLVAEAGIKDFSFSVRNIGLFGADLGVLRIGPDRNPALVIQSVQVDYSPRGLYRQKIDKITLSGIELYGGISNGRFKLRGVDIEKILRGAQPQDETTAASNETSPLVSLDRLVIRNSRINLEYNDQSYRDCLSSTCIRDFNHRGSPIRWSTNDKCTG